MKFGISGDVYGYYKNGQLVGFKSQADIDAAYQSGYADGQAAGETTHTGTYTIENPVSNRTIDLGVHHSYRYIDIVYTTVPWTTGDLDSIKYMCNNGNINVSDYWAIGDQRAETSSSVLGSTSQIWVLTDFNGSTSGGTGYTAIIHTLNLYPTDAKMNSTDTNAGGWQDSLMRTSTMPSIYNSLNSNFKPLIKTVSNVSGTGSQSNTTQITNDQIWLFSEREIQGAEIYSGRQEYNACKQFSYFTTSSNRVKTGNTGGFSGEWWLRSPTVSYSNFFCFVGTDVSTHGVYASYNLGVCAAAAI